MNLQHDIHEGNSSNNSNSNIINNGFIPSSMDQFGFSSSVHPVDNNNNSSNHHHHLYPSIDNMLTTTVSDLNNPYGDPSRYLGSPLYSPPGGGGVTSPTLAPVHRGYPPLQQQQHSTGGRHPPPHQQQGGQGGYPLHYPNPHHDQYAQKQPFRRQGYQQQQPSNYPPPPRGLLYGRGVPPLQQQQRQQMNHGLSYGYGGGNSSGDLHGHYMPTMDAYGGSPMTAAMPLPLSLPPHHHHQYSGGHSMYPPSEQQQMMMYHHPPPVEQSHHMHSPPYSRGGNLGNYRSGADRSYSNHNHNQHHHPTALVARPPISEQNLKPDEVIYQVTDTIVHSTV